MPDWLYTRGGRNRLVNWLGLDSWIDSSLASLWQRLVDRWNAASSFFARFKLTGWRRLLNELGSEMLTLGTGGVVLLYALSLPALQEIDEGRWLATGKYSVTFLDQQGNEIGKRGILHSDAVPLEEIPDYMIKATLSTEDRRFFEHFGIDVLGTLRAMVENLRANTVVQGGSTLTQQLAKNLFLSSERSFDRKLKEAFLALWLEARMTKRQILKLYFDRAYMGGGAFGVEAAAQFYFGKSIRHVTLAEAALLAGLFKAPTKYAPHLNLPATRARTHEVLSNLVEAGYMTEAEVYQARIKPAEVVETRATYSPDWFLDWAFEEVQRLAHGKNDYVLTARTTIDLSLQRAAEESLTSVIRQHGRAQRARQGALVAMEVDGAVRAIVGGMDYGESQFNRATAARRQPGSSFKPYVYAVALREGYTPNSVVYDRSRSCGNWTPKNYSGGWSGRRLSLAHALARSLNTVAAELSFSVGREKVLDLVQKLGIKGVRKTCSMALGDTGITPIEHTAGFATFANGGKLSLAYGVTEIHNSKGELVYSRERDEKPAPQIVPRRVAERLNTMLQLVVTEGTGRRAQLDFTYTAGKTGTSSSYRDAWFVGFSGKYVTGVWIGNDDFRPMGRVTGGSLPAMAWASFMSVAHKSMDIAQIPGLGIHPRQVEERQRMAALARADPSLAGQGKQRTTMSTKSRTVLRDIAGSFRKAGGLGPLPAATEPVEPQPKEGVRRRMTPSSVKAPIARP
ncbi:MAG: PBP1A family penicillin-binding protein [Hyphomicrobiaceae bacterium]|nr:PBP1A family penicillin-binding protein [Hyphomicrobiaceae bacterium]